MWYTWCRNVCLWVDGAVLKFLWRKIVNLSFHSWFTKSISTPLTWAIRYHTLWVQSWLSLTSSYESCILYEFWINPVARCVCIVGRWMTWKIYDTIPPCLHYSAGINLIMDDLTSSFVAESSETLANCIRHFRSPSSCAIQILFDSAVPRFTSARTA